MKERANYVKYCLRVPIPVKLLLSLRSLAKFALRIVVKSYITGGVHDLLFIYLFFEEEG